MVGATVVRGLQVNEPELGEFRLVRIGSVVRKQKLAVGDLSKADRGEYQWVVELRREIVGRRGGTNGAAGEV